MSNLVTLESPLHHADFSSLAALNIEGGVILREAKLLGHLNLRGNANNLDFLNGVKYVLDLDLPLQPCSSTQNANTTIMWLSPDEWLLIVEGGSEAAVEDKLRQSLSGHFAVSDISGAQTMLEISGKDCLQLLQKSIGYDLHLDSFPINKVIGTALAKSSAHIRRTGEQDFQLIIRRSFADYVWLWLQQSSKEYGLSVIL
ncbi:sarcosine oxidase subunit gamma family protein [uncultured Paraglaciecola sp.]|jgi:sarcosine oxidase subunit gamma|uniref:sarcosine oxidase subunit gamma n=1 Tax=uncultured Paraglaciecola sp. TaxID=1765024 RepID=UPI0025E6480A|nr:sarcosine oxidase subunit gamma family protein [uncultured Paraglaciecola sp.]